MSISFVHHFHSETSTVQNVGPSVNHFALVLNDGLVEVEAIQVKRHSANTKSGKPNANDWPSRKEKVQRPAVVEGSLVENQTTEVTVGCHDVVSLFFLAELIALVL